MQPAKINWKTKSRIDCWGGQSSKPSTLASAATSASNNLNQKRVGDVTSPPQKGPEKTLIEAQQELEQSLPKFSDNQPSNKIG